MRRANVDRLLADLLARQGKILGAAFLEAIADLASGIDYIRLVEALTRNDIEAAIVALNIEPAAFTRYVVAKSAIFAEAGALTSSYIPLPLSRTVQFRFDLTNPRAEAWIAQNVANYVTGIYIPEQRDGIRRTILAGYSRGEGPETIATTVAGRIDRVTGKRTGGVIGLSAPQERYVENMRARMASGNATELRRIFGMELRDKRMDAVLNRYIASGDAMPQDVIDKWASRYADKLLKARAETIARTETAQATEAAREESFRQALDKEGLPQDAVEKEWEHSGGQRGGDWRQDHMDMGGTVVQGMDATFDFPDGTKKRFAHDGIGGAAHDANCRCRTNYTIDWTIGLT